MHSLDPVFTPRTVAVVGASRSRDWIGWAIVHNMVEAQFTGAIYPVNPQAAAIHSLKCYPSLAAIPDQIDLAVVTVPRALVQGVVEEAIALGVTAFVIITAGYGETGAEGRALEAKLRATIRAAGARMVGPNCMGVINTDAAVSLNATFSPTPAVAGSVGSPWPEIETIGTVVRRSPEPPIETWVRLSAADGSATSRSGGSASGTVTQP